MRRLKLRKILLGTRFDVTILIGKLAPLEARRHGFSMSAIIQRVGMPLVLLLSLEPLFALIHFLFLSLDSLLPLPLYPLRV
jgi:hypothetical protein